MSDMLLTKHGETEAPTIQALAADKARLHGVAQQLKAALDIADYAVHGPCCFGGPCDCGFEASSERVKTALMAFDDYEKGKVNEQEQELTELRKDKERLDWLESNPVGIGYPTEEMSEEAFFIFTNDRDFGGKILRQAIDAAMKEGK